MPRLGLDVRVAYSGLAALKSACQEPPDLICLDVDMPGGNGFSACELLTGEDQLAQVPIIILTGKTDSDTIRRCHHLCAITCRSAPTCGRESSRCCKSCSNNRERPSHDKACFEKYPMTPQAFHILLAEDDDGHASLVQRNLMRSGIANEMARVRNGQEALDYIHRRGSYRERDLNGPLLLLLDINMPLLDGTAVLGAIKSDESTAKIPVIMLTTTDDPREIQRCYEMGCSVYVSKPVEYDKFVEAVKRLGLFLQIVAVPLDESHSVESVCRN